MNDLIETFTLVNGYDKRKTRETRTFRKFTVEDIKSLDSSSRVYIIDKRGEYREVRTNGRVKTWKRDPMRFECSFKYGLYENFRLNTDEMLTQLIVMV